MPFFYCITYLYFLKVILIYQSGVVAGTFIFNKISTKNLTHFYKPCFFNIALPSRLFELFIRFPVFVGFSENRIRSFDFV